MDDAGNAQGGYVVHQCEGQRRGRGDVVVGLRLDLHQSRIDEGKPEAVFLLPVVPPRDLHVVQAGSVEREGGEEPLVVVTDRPLP